MRLEKVDLLSRSFGMNTSGALYDNVNCLTLCKGSPALGGRGDQNTKDRDEIWLLVGVVGEDAVSIGELAQR